MRKISVFLSLVLLTTFGFAQNDAGDFHEGKIYVRLKSDINPRTGKPISPNQVFDVENLPIQTKPSGYFGVTTMQRAFRENASPKLNATMVMNFENHASVTELIKLIEKDSYVELVERIPFDRKHLVPNDPSLTTQWHLAKINAPGAWDFFSIGSTTVIAIVDDAVERTHPDLQTNIWGNPKEIAGNGLDDDGNGYVDDINGWDFPDNDNNPDPPTAQYDHGTHVAGIASAATNNLVGIASMGYSCKLMCIKASGSNPDAISAGYAGIIYAANNGANVINCSWGGSTFSATNQEVIDFARSKGSIVVASAGNNNNNAFSYPGAFNGVVSVASTDINDVKSSFSTYGDWVKISAPGSTILSTVPYGGYGNKSGTSMASPLVAGLVGLMKSVNPGMPNDDLLNCLYNTAESILQQNPTFPGQLGAGRINAQAAVACVSASLNKAPSAIFSGTPLAIVQGGKVTFTDKSIYNPTTWQWSFPGGTPSSFNGKTPPQITYNTPGLYSVTLTVSNNFGTDDTTIQNMITVSEPPSCVAVNYPATGTILDFLAPPQGANGFQNGVNANGDKQKAMYFDVSDSAQTGITSIYVRFNHINSINPDKKVRFRVYDGTTGTPGAELGMVERTKGQLRQDVQANRYTIIDLPQNILLPASKKFFISVDISELVWTTDVKDSLSIRASFISVPAVSPIWYQNSAGTWIRYGSPESTWQNAATYLLISPYMTSRPAKSVISPVNQVVCQGTATEFDATGSQYSSLIKWEFPGANNPSVVENQLKVTPQYANPGVYKVFLSTKGGCDELRLDSTTYTINAAPSISVNASKNPICQGETSTLTASGATTYTWSPSTGLSATSGSTILANPSTTTMYTITGQNGNCSGQVNFELEVRSRSTDVSISASEININAPTMVVFTAAGLNGGSAPVYNFFVNDQSVQNGPNSIMVRTVSPGDKIKCEFTSSEACVAEKVVLSNVITMGDPALPVSLFNFTGVILPGVNQLMWVTSSEINSSSFEVEKSRTGTNFEKIGEKAAAGNSTLSTTYYFDDMKPEAGNNFYRLRMIDRDGSFRYSKVLLLDNSNRSGESILYPNPTPSGNPAKLVLGSVSEGWVNVTISDVTGRILKTTRTLSANGSVVMELTSAGLKSGSYLIICKDAQGKTIGTYRWQVIK